ncbi:MULTISPECIES: bifunctional precorrin-2 dehydrogenase/sirohydrochlorin ferrochelatase [Cytobacillus]|jgi:precorrin-2 dehydrogenase / sirohydrochlorin ferrochelatase|uniref:precorrin-2 dehydrogenase n=1 Tax=Cytobacillus pseudoceanisediminis TaxID=3051614 RepID=A0ABZ2ZRR7_9BACI|nr:NAD(P)-dependent oxidoreductase [Cytobacillus oceanisediminis]MCS0826001.1 potassium transporter Trk [Cytobacillus firmus]MCM3244180.1 potassium transporter Trk [Cytobacillus oceanisediminis]MCM3402573.1 potassium transporter Trk [Cytobacillus oceanisediminis]MDK7668967.1 NAD(P)-dependent oxidoreductase [Cytobacillus oceanisediminis]USK46923.1 potassium transporter Trk [Cytobacillus oceanisediminis]
MQPLFINLTNKKIVIAGGGRIAFRKAKTLDGERANITFVAPDFTDDIICLAHQRGYELIQREAHPEDFKDAFLSILATNIRETNQQLARSLDLYQLVCVVDEAGEGNAIFPAAVRRGPLQIAITSNGASPKLTRMLKKQLDEQFDESWTGYSEFLAKCREHIKKLSIHSAEKNELLAELLDDRYRLSEDERESKWAYLSSLK